MTMSSSYAKYPWPSTVNVATFVTVKPDLKDEASSNSFHIWKEQMLCLLESQDVVGFIDGQMTEPPAETEQKLWRRTDRLVKGWILGTIGRDAIDAVWKLQTARDVWLKLDAIFTEKPEIQSERRDETRGLASVNPASSPGGLDRHNLYEVALRGDWRTAKSLFDKYNKEALEGRVGDNSETVLHAAVLTGKANGNDFVKNLVELMSPEALAIQDRLGNTALHKAAMVGNTEAAITLVNKNPRLLYIAKYDNTLPVVTSAIYCQKDTLEYLISMMESNAFEGQLGIQLLNRVIASEFFDVALEMIERHPILGRGVGTYGRYFPLFILAGMAYVFPSGQSFSWWQKLIYRRIPLKQPKCKLDVKQKLELMLWKVFEHLVPPVRGIREKKSVHQQALALVRCFSGQMASSSESKASKMLGESILEAATNGISEIVEVIMEMHPVATMSRDSSGKNIFHLAVVHRFENVMNLIYSMSDRKYMFFDNVDKQSNNYMHLCAKLALPNRLNLVPGASLQMQWELQWFKETEKFVHPSRRIWRNKANKTPKEIFIEEHKKLKEEGEKWMKDTANACTISAALIATVMFAAAFTVPGGVASETGIPIFSNKFALVLFAISDAISLFKSITSLLMFLSILTSRYAEEDFMYVLPKRLSIGLLCLFVSITFMMVVFSATLHLVFGVGVARLVIPVVVLACLPVASFVLLQFPLVADVIYSTYGPGIFGKRSVRLLY